MLKTEKLNKIYIKKIRNHLSKNQVLTDITVGFPKKGMIFILGKSGCGKSTLIDILSGMNNFDSGEVFVTDKPIKNWTQRQLDNYRNGMIGFIFQEFYLIENLNVRENILLAAQLQNKKIDEDKIDALLTNLDLEPFIKYSKINELSGGQKQRIAIARCLVKETKIILADEPTGNLDHETSELVFDKLKNISKEKLVIVISHDIHHAYKYADRIIKIKDGQIKEDLIRKTNNANKKVELKKVNNEESINQLKMLNENETNFKLTENSVPQVTYEPQDFKSLPSYIKLKTIIKMALNTLKLKKMFLIVNLVIIPTIMINIISKPIISSVFTANQRKSWFDFTILKFISFWYRPLSILITEKKYILSLLMFIPFIIPFLMILMYFKITIRLKQKEIGILRALGSNIYNTIKIFLVECIIFSLLCFLINLFWLNLDIKTQIIKMLSKVFQTSGSNIFNFVITDKKIIGEIIEKLQVPVKTLEDLDTWLQTSILGFFTIENLFIRNICFISNLIFCILSFCILSIMYPIYKLSTKKPTDIINNR
ncbi:MAG: ABC transporter ATP-binding protein [Vigna little leaf phytoplasma]|nr:ABC transporter ATP-binding protein [Vigna little leaf phytoplasma]